MNRGLKKWLPGSRWLVIGTPYLWLLLFFAIPFAIVLKISFSHIAEASPPYTNLIEHVKNDITLRLNLGNYQAMFDNPKYLGAFLSSLKIAAISTFFCLMIGYPLAYAISRLNPSARNIAMMLVILPSWTSFLIRIYAWMGILKDKGIINNMLLSLGIIDEPITMLYTPMATYIAIVYAYLPFMVMPLYANLIKHDNRLLEAAYDLGATPMKAFLRITLPLSMAGIIAGSMLVFIPAVGEFVIPELVGGPDTKMIGKALWDEYFQAGDWPRASAIATTILLVLVIPIMIFHRYQAKQMEDRLS
jgi:putrescine transport system permease protein